MILTDFDIVKDTKLFNSIASKTLICLPRKLEIHGSKLSTQLLLQLLSPLTKKLCTWLEDLLKYKNGKNLQFLNIKFDAVDDIDIDKLIEFIKSKCTKDATLYFKYNQALISGEDDGEEEYENLRKLGNKLLRYFDDSYSFKYKEEKEDVPSLWIGFDGVDGYETFFMT
uniref:DUF38 domain-containing protein n=1 Tax=Panagrolaimus sp. ES5 TaxID=591445 RepID=A0AC34FDQ2_9BILA